MNFQNPSGGVNITQQQLATLINLLSKQPAANPSSPNFDPNYFSQVLNLGQNNQVAPNMVDPRQNGSIDASKYNLVRVVDDPSTIQAKEVVMGVDNLFPSSDGEKIFVKTWGNDGRIIPRVYVLQDEASIGPQAEDSRIDEMEERISSLETAVAKLKSQKKSTTKPKPKPKPQKAVTPINENDVKGDVYDDES